MPLLDKLREQYGVGPVCSELHRPVNVLPLSATATSS